MTKKTTIRSLRMITSFALLGAVLAGAFFGWSDQSADAVRALGAAGGAAIGVASTLKALHLFG
jgi:hypothetical protein